MGTDDADLAAEMPQPCDEWRQLLAAADRAGRWAARQLACCCSARQLARGGNVNVGVEPADSPVMAWLQQHGYGTDTGTGLVLPVAVSAEALRPAARATRKSQSLLVRHAYAAAFCTVLAEEAGVAAEIRLEAAPAAMPHLMSTCDAPAPRSPSDPYRKPRTGSGNAGRPAPTVLSAPNGRRPERGKQREQEVT